MSGIQMIKSRDLAERLTTRHLQAFSVQFPDHHSNTGPFNNWTQIYHLNTRPVQYSDGSVCFPNGEKLPDLASLFETNKANLGLKMCRNGKNFSIKTLAVKKNASKVF